MHRSDPATKDFLAQNLSSAKVEKYCLRDTLSSVSSQLNRDVEEQIKIQPLCKCLDLETLVT